jgi:hypothetical protein
MKSRLIQQKIRIIQVSTYDSARGVGRFKDEMTYDEYLADFASQFHDLGVSPNFAAALDPAQYSRTVFPCGRCATERGSIRPRPRDAVGATQYQSGHSGGHTATDPGRERLADAYGLNCESDCVDPSAYGSDRRGDPGIHAPEPCVARLRSAARDVGYYSAPRR